MERRGGTGARPAVAAIAFAGLAAPLTAQAKMTVKLNGEMLTAVTQPGGGADRLAIDLDGPNRAVSIEGDLASPYPAACEASSEGGALSCPLAGEVLMVRVRSGGGADRI